MYICIYIHPSRIARYKLKKPYVHLKEPYIHTLKGVAVAACCSVLQLNCVCIDMCIHMYYEPYIHTLKGVAVAVCCSVLQFVLQLHCVRIGICTHMCTHLYYEPYTHTQQRPISPKESCIYQKSTTLS